MCGRAWEGGGRGAGGGGGGGGSGGGGGILRCLGTSHLNTCTKKNIRCSRLTSPTLKCPSMSFF